jgi:uncharacterized protein (TIGR03437 family)
VRSILAGLLGLLPLTAQFGEFATTGDGSVLYFTSPMTFRGGPANLRPETRLYRLGPQGVQLYFEIGPLARPDSFRWNDGALLPQVSSDGGAVAFTIRGVCQDEECLGSGTERAELRGVYNGTVGRGMVSISRNGRWAAIRPQSPFGGSLASGTLVHISSGDRAAIPFPVSDLSIANDGSVLTATPQPAVWRDGLLTRLPFEGAVRLWALSPDARFVLYSHLRTPIPPQFAVQSELRIREVATGIDRVLFTPPAERQVWFGGMSDDARYVLVRTSANRLEGESFVLDTETLEVNPLTLRRGELSVAGAIGGDGRIVYLGTTHGRILRFSLAGGRAMDRQTVLEGPPIVTGPPTVAPGSLVRLEAGLAPTHLDGKILLDGRKLHFIGAEGSQIFVQIPWDQPLSFPARLELDLPSSSLFEFRAPVVVTLQSPVFERASGGTFLGGIKVVKGDFSGLQTTTPNPGDVIHLYMTGLGEVERPERTGVPAGPVPNPVRLPAACHFAPHPSPATTLFAGLAPGLLGVYQLSLRIPDDAGTAPVTGFQCTFGHSGISGGIVLVPQGRRGTLGLDGLDPDSAR